MNHVIYGVADSQREGTILGGCLGISKALAIFAAPVTAALLQKGSFNRQ